jgi:hypothetical protein
MKPIIVIGGGWSFLPHFTEDLRTRGIVIGVNDAAVHTRVHIAVTMDRLWLEGRGETMDYLAIPTYYREGTCKNGKPPHMGLPYANNNRMDEGMSLEPGVLNGNNSGAIALNLAFKMHRTSGSQVYLLGFDMCNGPKDERHWHPPYPWKGGGGSTTDKLREWSREFAPWAKQFADAGIDVKNVSDRSILTNWKKISYEKFKKETGDV